MAEFKKYLMKNQNDYRPSENNHEVILIKSTPQGDWAYGRFTTIDEDMIDLIEEEKLELPKRDIPKISLRQCREQSSGCRASRRRLRHPSRRRCGQNR